jgi:hypothetical protein
LKDVAERRAVPWKKRAAVWALNGVVRVLCATLRLRVVGEPDAERLIAAAPGAVLCCWHGRIVIPIDRFRGRSNYHGMISPSRDGDIQAEMFRLCGMGAIRGSTGRRAVLATREVLSVLKRGDVLLFTPDGPRGPSGAVHPGAIYFAMRTGKPIIPAGISAFPRWELRTWDRFLIPKPFARASLVYGDPIYVGPDEDAEAAAGRLADALNQVEALAERACGAVVEGERLPAPQPSSTP